MLSQRGFAYGVTVSRSPSRFQGDTDLKCDEAPNSLVKGESIGFQILTS